MENSRFLIVMMRRCQKASAAIILIIDIAWMASSISDMRSSITARTLVCMPYSMRARKTPGIAVKIKLDRPNRPEVPVNQHQIRV